jgi:hypothetical protein
MLCWFPGADVNIYARTCTLPKIVRTCTLPKIASTCTLPKIARTCTLPKIARTCTLPKIATMPCSNIADSYVPFELV